MISAGRLRHLVAIDRAVETQNAFGEPVITWSLFASVWARVEPLSGREYFAARQVSSEQMVKITARYLAGVTAKMRVTYGSNVYDIQDVIDVDKLGVEMQLMCKVRS